MIIYLLISLVALVHYSLSASVTFPVIMQYDPLMNEDNDEGYNEKDDYSYYPFFSSNLKSNLTLRQTTTVDISLSPKQALLLHIRVEIGNPHQIFYFRLCTVEAYVWVKNIAQKGFDEKLSTTCKSSAEIIHIEGFNLKGTVARDDVTIGSLALKEFPFIVVDNSTFDDPGIIGLGKANSVNKQLSFIEILYQKNLISKKIFYIKLSQGNDALSIGEYPPEVLKQENKFYFHQHKLIVPKTKGSDSTKIATTLSAVFVEGESRVWEVNDIVSFSYGANCLLVSWDFFDHLRHNVFNQQMQNQACIYHENNKYEYMTCFKSKLTQHITINFIFGDWTYRFSEQDFLLEKDESLVVLVKKKSFNGWIFGYPFFKKYVTVFDLEEDKIGIFYRPSS